MPARPPFRLTARAPADPEPDLCLLLVTHRAIREDLLRLAARLDQFTAASRESAAGTAVGRYTAALLAQIRAHHEHEDRVLWPLVAVTAGECVDLAPLTDDHYAIEAELARAARALAAFRASDRRQAAALRTSVSGLRDMLDEHIADEEGRVVPVMRRYLPAHAYQWAERRAWRHASPASLGFRVPWLARFAGPGELSRLLAADGWPARVLLVFTRGRYARLERQAFPAPPAARNDYSAQKPGR
jgi:hemerythrin-like domain-containing protein